MDDTKKLKPCPFCGGRAELTKFRQTWSVGCARDILKCPCKPWTGSQWTEEKAIEIWNRRAET